MSYVFTTICYYQITMNITFKSYEFLPEESKKIRTDVFIKEQGFIDEFDKQDETAIHILIYVDGNPIGTSRIIYSNDHHSYVIGRFAIVKEYRRKHLGKELMKYTEQEIVKRFGHIQIGVSAQERAIKFYESNGYQITDERYLDQNYPHVWMVKQL